jgi:UDP-N-acetylmuramate: L-alanyl-gamma-D-glutamyl-meso-diaminopimelate ligase
MTCCAISLIRIKINPQRTAQAGKIAVILVNDKLMGVSALDLEKKLNCAPARMERIYLMGIGGVAMGALAGGLADAGYEVRGSDNPLYPPMSTFLAEKNIPYAAYNPANLQPAPDLVVVGNVIRRDNPEAAELARLQLPYLSMPQALRQFFIKDNLSLAVAGTHGKTTTTALTISALAKAGKAPGYLLGGLLGGGMGNFAAADGGIFVVEGDEYDTAFFDKRPKFAHYAPDIGILTSCEFDHADIYPNFAAVCASFDLFAADVKRKLIAWGDQAEVMARAAKCGAAVETYGCNPGNDWRLLRLRSHPTGGMTVEFSDPQGDRHNFRTPLTGRHNALNLLASLAALRAAGLDTACACRVQADFPGIARRLQIKGVARQVMVVDDFAHHPTAVEQTIAAVAEFGLPGWRPGRIAAVFEPRSNTSRRRVFQKDYARAFARAPLVFLREPARKNDLAPEEVFSAAELAADINRMSPGRARAFPDSDSLLAALTASLRPGDLCLIMSNGDFDNLHARLLQALA